MQNSTLTFSNLDSDYSLWFQAYCLNPPNDSCDFGPCPNLDVTGIGQQISGSWTVPFLDNCGDWYVLMYTVYTSSTILGVLSIGTVISTLLTS